MKVQSIFSPVRAKTLLIGTVLLFVIGTGSAFAYAKSPVGDRVQESFKREFAGAQFVQWYEVGDYYKASFVLAGHRAEAYFTKDAEFQGCIRDLFFDQLPLSVMKSFDKRFANAAILDVREITNNEGTFYSLNLEYNNRKYHVRSDADGNFIEVEKDKK